MENQNRQHIIITGATSGIGRELARQWAWQGAKLALIGRSFNRENTLKLEFPNLGIEEYEADVRDQKRTQDVATEIISTWPKVDIVVANAGIGVLNPGADFSLAIDRQTIETNYFGMLNFLTPFIPHLIKQGYGHIVGVSSLAGIRGLPNAGSYSASKAAQSTMLESLRLDLAPYGIAVTDIKPGFVQTKMTAHEEFPLPFNTPVEKAATLMIAAMAQKKKVFAFPWPMRILSLINKFMPVFLYDFLLPILSKSKGAKKKARIF